MKPNPFITEIESSVAGIPCLIGVLGYESVRGSFSQNAASDVDYYGYADSEWVVLDRKGYRAQWLERKLTAAEIDRIEERINEFFSNSEEY